MTADDRIEIVLLDESDHRNFHCMLFYVHERWWQTDRVLNIAHAWERELQLYYRRIERRTHNRQQHLEAR